MKKVDLLRVTTFPDGRGKSKCAVGDVVYVENLCGQCGLIKVQLFQDSFGDRKITECIEVADGEFSWTGSFAELKSKLSR